MPRVVVDGRSLHVDTGGPEALAQLAVALGPQTAAVALACKGLSPFLRGAASPAQANGVATSSTRVHAPQFCPI